MKQTLLGRTFDFLVRRKTDYQLCFSSPAGQRVLTDLMQFCGANTAIWHEDPRQHAVLTGRYEVFLRIQQHVNIPPEKLFQLYSGLELPKTTGEENG